MSESLLATEEVKIKCLELFFVRVSGEQQNNEFCVLGLDLLSVEFCHKIEIAREVGRALPSIR
jgi:hypothetical protein